MQNAKPQRTNFCYCSTYLYLDYIYCTFGFRVYIVIITIHNWFLACPLDFFFHNKGTKGYRMLQIATKTFKM